MPFKIKFVLSVVVFVAGLTTFAVQRDIGHIGPSYAALLLGVFMVVAMWIFPEVTRRAGKEPSSRAERDALRSKDA